MGSTLTINNNTPRNIYVEWWTVGEGFKIAGYNIDANSSKGHSEEAVWYDVVIIDGGVRKKATYYGGQNATWIWDGTNILFVSGKSNPEARGIEFEAGSVRLPLDNPHVKRILDFVRALDYKPVKAE